jgi:lysozyme
MRHVTQEGLSLIKRFEGFSPTIYLDAAGLPTIGYGHLLRPGEAEMFRRGISHEAGIALLIKDVEAAERSVLRLITVPLTNGQFDALVSFTFNLGGGALQRSTLRRKVNREEHDDVHSCAGSGLAERNCADWLGGVRRRWDSTSAAEPLPHHPAPPHLLPSIAYASWRDVFRASTQ